MESKRTKLWRRKEFLRVFKKRMLFHASVNFYHRYIDGHPAAPLHWFELAEKPYMRCYRTCSTPCSCFLCKGTRYDRRETQKETRRILKESED